MILGAHPESAGGFILLDGGWLPALNPQADEARNDPSPSAGAVLANRYDTGRSDLKSSDCRADGILLLLSPCLSVETRFSLSTFGVKRCICNNVKSAVELERFRTCIVPAVEG